MCVEGLCLITLFVFVCTWWSLAHIVLCFCFVIGYHTQQNKLVSHIHLRAYSFLLNKQMKCHVRLCFSRNTFSLIPFNKLLKIFVCTWWSLAHIVLCFCFVCLRRVHSNCQFIWIVHFDCPFGI
jgi:hypothetical protein